MDEHPAGGGIGAGASRQPPPQQHGGNSSANPPVGGGVMVSHQPDELPRTQQQYTIPGILHYIQHEWARFEMERAHWEVERAELQPQSKRLQTPPFNCATRLWVRAGAGDHRDHLCVFCCLPSPAQLDKSSTTSIQVTNPDESTPKKSNERLSPAVYKNIPLDLQAEDVWTPSPAGTALTPSWCPDTRRRRQKPCPTSVGCQARIAFLQGERKGQENLKSDLVRRIKMLEYALKQERAKYHKLKYGKELNQGEMKMPSFDSDTKDSEVSAVPANSQLTWKQGRQLLRQYLQEVGYTDTILDVRTQRVRSLLGLAGSEQNGSVEKKNLQQLINGSESCKEQRSPGDVLETFNFLENAEDSDEDEEEDGDLMDDVSPSKAHRSKKHRNKVGNEGLASEEDADTEEALKEFDFLVTAEDGEGAGEARSSGDGTEWGESGQPEAGPGPGGVADAALLLSAAEPLPFPAAGGRSFLLGSDDVLESVLGLGDLAGLTVANDDTDYSYEVSGVRACVPAEALRPGVRRCSVPSCPPARTRPSGRPGAPGTRSAATLTACGRSPSTPWSRVWSPCRRTTPSNCGTSPRPSLPRSRCLLSQSQPSARRGHAPLGRGLSFSPSLFSRSASFDVEPVYTFRGDVGPVLSLAMSSSGEQCFSGGLDSTIQWWSLPGSSVDPYDTTVGSPAQPPPGPGWTSGRGTPVFSNRLLPPFAPVQSDSGVLAGSWRGHTDAVWGLAYSGIKNRLLSCSADGTVKLWNPSEKSPCVCTFNTSGEYGIPTSVDFNGCDPANMVVSFNGGDVVVYDLETEKSLLVLRDQKEAQSASPHINKVVGHPQLPLTITAHEDRHINFYDNKSGKVIHSMVAHLDAVTSLAVDPNGIYLISGSHDCSLRLWNLDSKTCVQEITAHRKKSEEAIYDVAFHPSKAFIASAGADALARVYV
ncbi:unnamed protein product [Tetraodon nigroviridis]|uniref:(spotted green pufferfish) hypothetical protein n=1 Tax=Tetraodon nigroviridis TaxID=99883 RepID=Q4TBT3_TETNG|nr:unnamed protein product [Tetraodon nigroviridis]